MNELCSDGGTQYIGEKFTEILEKYKIRQKTTAPYHPKGNQHAVGAI